MRRKLVVTAAVLGAALAPVPAWAFWSGSSNVTGTASSATLGAPTANASVVSGDIRIDVTAKPSSGPTPSGYVVRRAGGSTDICSITGATGNCTDPSPAPGANSYQVFAKLGTNWMGATPAEASATIAGTRSFGLSTSASPTVGTPFTINMQALSNGGLEFLNFSTINLTWSGAAAAPNGTAQPTLPAQATFGFGIENLSVTLVKAGTVTLTVTDAAYPSRFGTINLTVRPAAPSSYTLSGASTAQAGVAYGPMTVNAFDTYGNAATNYNGTNQTLTWSGAAKAPVGSAMPTASTSGVAFSGGTATVASLTFVKAETVQLKATNGSVTTPTALPITVTGGVPASAAWGTIAPLAGMPGTVTYPTAASAVAKNLGSDATVTGTINLIDAYGNPASNAGANWTVSFSATKSKGQGPGVFTVGSLTGTSVDAPVSATGAAAVSFSYKHTGDADWIDNLTIRLVRPAGTTATTLTADLYKTT